MANVASRKQDPYLQAYVKESLKWIQNDRIEAWNVIWYDPELEAAPLAELPHDRFFHSKTPIGPSESLAVFRTGWDKDAVVVTLDGSDWFSHHDRFDAASFTIFYQDELAIDPGYTDDELQSWRFFRRTAAHNTIVVDSPEAAKEWVNHSWGWDGGGQRLPIVTNRPRSVEQYFSWKHPDDPETPLFEMADMVAFESGEGYGYAAVDATKAYRASQLSRFMRHLVFLKPDTVVIYDVVDTPRGREPQWLMQTVHEPELNTGALVVTNGGGELRARTLLPAEPAVQVDQTPAAWRLNPRYRVSVKSVAGESAEGDLVRHRFLHVMSIGDKGAVVDPDVTWQVVGDELVLHVQRGEASETILLAWEGKPGLRVGRRIASREAPAKGGRNLTCRMKGLALPKARSMSAVVIQ